ncbi:type I-E CRISPR-associated protein Cas5/CasD [Geobacter benzoatilyticus]|uniref:Type I-E CRISPR-associated protein Cas5/CasD n=1 Tax=Geobacter benzoatilyticus TaxID=2815309 RepID=A0ABX7PZY2_9BACT|nr:type I-E CRISPR-associated protein Cas5/CasD [Geobacter benzoatilyticus]QSV44699.1 type I-E CRISPR-associated protein Cas5/CasD [Geobacter benzoatilyticus]
MRDYLILKLQGPMQSWGEHTFEGKRPSGNFPTRSALLGLLGACLGIRRNEAGRLQQLADSVAFAVRKEERFRIRHDGRKTSLPIIKATDYHTVRDAREDYSGLKSHETIQTWREYLFDAVYTVVAWNTDVAMISLVELEQAVKSPHFTPYLGRRSCPLSRPLFEASFSAANACDALHMIPSDGGVIYSEEPGETRTIRLRDVPLVRHPRQFASRNVHIYGGGDVSE